MLSRKELDLGDTTLIPDPLSQYLTTTITTTFSPSSSKGTHSQQPGLAPTEVGESCPHRPRGASPGA